LLSFNSLLSKAPVIKTYRFLVFFLLAKTTIVKLFSFNLNILYFKTWVTLIANQFTFGWFRFLNNYLDCRSWTFNKRCLVLTFLVLLIAVFTKSHWFLLVLNLAALWSRVVYCFNLLRWGFKNICGRRITRGCDTDNAICLNNLCLAKIYFFLFYNQWPLNWIFLD
jgi:hypothetical protein